jgi:hypothetical protein
VLAYFRGGHLIARIPLYFERRLGVMLCRMPKLVHTWGIVMEPLEGKRATMISREMEILTVFGEELANQTCFVQAFRPTLTNRLPFYWKDFRQQTRFGYVFEDVTTLERIWEHMECNVRRHIRKVVRASSVVSMVAEKAFNFERGFGASLVAYNRILKLPRPAQACCALMGIS